MSDRAFEDRIRELTVPRGEVYPRPWTTDTDPSMADVLIVGASSAKPFAVGDVGSHDQFLDALWNRNGQTCRSMYAVAAPRASRTRPNLERLAAMLAANGLTSLQTNISCASAPYDADLSAEDRAHGTSIFRAIVAHVPWKAMILYGVGASSRFGGAFEVSMPLVPPPESEPVSTVLFGRPVFIAPTLAPPSYRTSVWPYMERVVLAVVRAIRHPSAAESVPAQTRPTRTVAQRPSTDASQGSGHHQSTPADFVVTDANLVVWRRLQKIAATTALNLRINDKQCSLSGGPEHASTTRVFRHQFGSKKPELLLRDDVMQSDPTLHNLGDWAAHSNPAFHRVRTDDLVLINRILDAIDAFAKANAP